MSARILDTHCHLASAKFSGEAEDVIVRAVDAGTGGMLTLSTCFDDMPANLALAAAHPGLVVAAVGIHPCDTHEVDSAGDWKDRLLEMAAAPGVAAIGESGLDYYHPPPDGWDEEDFRARQREMLRGHFEVAAAAGLGIVLHTRDRSGRASLEDALAVARDFKGRVRPQFHCFLGPWEAAPAILDLDGIVSFGGVITFPSAKETLAAAVAAPAGSFTLETDSPYLAPVPHRGKRNEPAYVLATARHLASARGESLESLAEHTTKAARAFFRWPEPA
ncbi:MAG: TatD family hydrolase [Verrucomicrobiales bacterium]